MSAPESTRVDTYVRNQTFYEGESHERCVAQKEKQDKSGAPSQSTAQIVRRYIDARPVVREALVSGIVNLSALSRRILDETAATSEEAILVACRRYTFKAVPSGYEDAIREVLAASKLEVRTRVGILTARAHWSLFPKLEGAMRGLRGRGQQMHVIQGSEALTVVADTPVLDDLQRILDPADIEKRRDGLVELNLRASSVVEDVPGILSFIVSSLSARRINMVDVISCHKDNMFLIDEGDLFAAFEVLNGLTRG